MNQNLKDFFSYVQPILSGSLGFIKTEGYFTHIPGAIVAMSADETYCAIIKIPVIFDVYITAQINTFIQLKTPEVQTLENLYFVGWNVKNRSLMSYFNYYNDIDSILPCIYSEPDCFNIPKFDECMASSSISNVIVTTDTQYYIVSASKSITQASKADTVSLKIYQNPENQLIKTVRYTVYKKKFKLPVDIYSNILQV